MFTHVIETTCHIPRRFWRPAVRTVFTDVEAHSEEELGRITRAVLTAIDDTLPGALVSSIPHPLP
ncbi:hypothetical protein ABZ733_06975 [Streptomyces longwoodensis]|uniref:hypothetical protein n=1 Tax=Streptomyces longwoodensis TaxID=68231 RepID=UPI0033C0127A